MSVIDCPTLAVELSRLTHLKIVKFWKEEGLNITAALLIFKKLSSVRFDIWMKDYTPVPTLSIRDWKHVLPEDSTSVFYNIDVSMVTRS